MHEVAEIHTAGRTYARDGGITFVVVRAVIAPGCVGAEEANIGLDKLDPMKGSPGMGASEWSYCGHMKRLRPELGPASAIDYGRFEVDKSDWVELGGGV